MSPTASSPTRSAMGRNRPVCSSLRSHAASAVLWFRACSPPASQGLRTEDKGEERGKTGRDRARSGRAPLDWDRDCGAGGGFTGGARGRLDGFESVEGSGTEPGGGQSAAQATGRHSGSTAGEG